MDDEEKETTETETSGELSSKKVLKPRSGRGFRFISDTGKYEAL